MPYEKFEDQRVALSFTLAKLNHNEIDFIIEESRKIFEELDIKINLISKENNIDLTAYKFKRGKVS